MHLDAPTKLASRCPLPTELHLPAPPTRPPIKPPPPRRTTALRELQQPPALPLCPRREHRASPATPAWLHPPTSSRLDPSSEATLRDARANPASLPPPM